ncbi:MAG: DNA/RNA non-specific endonuclease [Gammaproteobacteria bacterium]|nr:DNA/RNA non-specific endonuclease [Gammaproteobacteria bacterium]
MKNITLVLLAYVVFFSNAEADTLSVHCPIGCPSNPTGNDLIFKHVYALSNNPTTKFADWVAYEVNVVNFGASPGRIWKSDPLLDDDETLEIMDYDGANKALKVDRGHQAPLASFASSRYWSELNNLSNITPQSSALNQGPWKQLESAVRKGVEYRHSLYVITGLLYENTMEVITLPQSDEPHVIPTGYFKIIYELDGNAVGFIMKQDIIKTADYCGKKVSIDSIREKIRFSLPSFIESPKLMKRVGCYF